MCVCEGERDTRTHRNRERERERERGRERERECVYVCVCMCVCSCLRACVRVLTHMCVRERDCFLRVWVWVGDLMQQNEQNALPFVPCLQTCNPISSMCYVARSQRLEHFGFECPCGLPAAPIIMNK